MFLQLIFIRKCKAIPGKAFFCGRPKLETQILRKVLGFFLG